MGHQARRNDLIGRIILSSFVLLVSRTGLFARPHRSRYVLQQSPVTRRLEFGPWRQRSRVLRLRPNTLAYL
jgi:hypothetical protein